MSDGDARGAGERIRLIHTCSGNGCGRPVGAASWDEWVHEDGTSLCGAGLGSLPEAEWRWVDVPVPTWVLIGRAKRGDQ